MELRGVTWVVTRGVTWGGHVGSRGITGRKEMDEEDYGGAVVVLVSSSNTILNDYFNYPVFNFLNYYSVILCKNIERCNQSDIYTRH